MCNFRSGIIFKDKTIIAQGDDDSHTTLLEGLSIEDNITNAMTLFVRAELLPSDGEWWTDPDTWRFRVDQDILPDWFTDDGDKYEAMFREAVKAWWKKHVLVNKEVYVLNDGFYMVKDCHITKLAGNVYIWKMYNSQVGFMSDSSRIDEMHGYSQVNTMSGDSRVGVMFDDSQIGTMYSNSRIDEMFNDSQVDAMYDGSQVNKMYYNSQVNKMYGCSRIGEMNGDSRVEEMHDHSQIGFMFGNNQVGEMRGNSMACKMYGGGKIGKMYDNSVAIRQDEGKMRVYTACKDRVMLI